LGIGPHFQLAYIFKYYQKLKLLFIGSIQETLLMLKNILNEAIFWIEQRFKFTLSTI